MSLTTRRILAWLPMLGLLCLTVRAASVWNRLPAVMASHFGASGVADGWMPRGQFFLMSFATTAPVIALLAVIAERVGRRKHMTSMGLLALDWLTSALLIVVFWSAINANLYHQRLAVVPVWVIIAALVPVGFGIGIDWRWWFSQRRKVAVANIARDEQVLARERHGSGRFAVALLGLGLGVLALVLAAPPHHPPLLISAILGISTGAIALSALWAWHGFEYRFTTDAVEVRSLGIRLRRIPLSEIRDFDAQEVHPLTDFGGWGIKGFGSDTAYIWGGRTALHIKTYQGDVYLGHKDPERLVRDLEQVTSAMPR